MYFNRQSFNKGAFYNRTTPSQSVSFAGTSAMVFSTEAGSMRALARYGNATSNLVFTAVSKLSGVAPLSGDTGIVFGEVGNFSSYANCEGQSGIVFDAIASAIRVANDKAITLDGLQFKPNDTIVIDTETLDVFINGEPDVSSWVVGSDFFQLGKGVNTLTFYDNATNRELTVTVIWADRWL